MPLPSSSIGLQATLLRIERLRTFCILGFVVFFEILYAVRIFLLGSLVPRWGLLAFPLFGAYEIAILLLVQKAIVAREKALPASLWIFNIVLEICLPALGLAYLASPRLTNDFVPLASPFVLTFFAFIMLSILRLHSHVSHVAGIVGSIAYFAAAYHSGWRISIDQVSRSSVTQSAVVMYGLMILASGVIAGAIAGELRKYVQAAVREAETQQQLKQVVHDLEIARSIQQSLLPRTRPRISGFEVAGWNRSAEATGGDYFDWKELPDGRFVITMADVTGHGIGPALFASTCRAYSRASFNQPEGLTATLQRINNAFGEDVPKGNFATFVAVICSPDKDQVQVLSAGQGPLFCLRTNQFEQIMPQAIPLGLMPELQAEPTVLDLQLGDVLVLVTDGFFEWENRMGEQYGLERLSNSLQRVRHLSPDEIIAELYSAVRDFSSGNEQADDLTAVVIKRVGTLVNKSFPVQDVIVSDELVAR